jgi:alpha-amylase
MWRFDQTLRWAGIILSLCVSLAVAPNSLAQPDNNLVYQVFVRSFADTPTDTVPAGEPGEIGDLKGIRENLGYLNDGDPNTDNDLEVGILWLMPIFPSRSYHGYDVTDFRNVNPDYGTLQDLKDLVLAAHQRGVRVILDIPFNHTSNEHPWFKDAVENPGSRFRKFYHFRDVSQSAPPGPWHIATSSTGKKVRYFGLFSFAMPDLNFDEPEVRKEINAIAKFWLEQGMDGFRLDAAKHIFGDTFGDLPDKAILRNNDWWREFSDAVYQLKPGAVLVGEVLGSQETLRRHAYGNDALLDEPFMNSARSRIAFPKAGLVSGWKDFVNRCRDVNRLAHQGPGSAHRREPFATFLFLASHDASPRLASYLEEMKQHGMQASVDEAYRVGMYVLTALGKYPILYNGDEVMQRGFKWNGNPPNAQPPGDGSGIYDETLREPFPWRKSGDAAPQTGWFKPRFDVANDGISVEEQEAPGKMLHLIRGLTNLRTKHPDYANGELGAVLTDSEDWMVFEKVGDRDRYLVLINAKGSGNDYKFHEGWFPQFIGAQLIFRSDGSRREWKDETGSAKHIEGSAFVPPYGMVVLRQKRG